MALISFRRRIKREIPLEKEERMLLWIMAITAIITAIFAVFVWLGIKPPFFMKYGAVIEIILIAVLVVTIIYFLYQKRKWIILHFKKPVETRINNHYRNRLQKEIMLELETEVKTKNIVLADKEKDEVLQVLTANVVGDIMDRQRPTPSYNALRPRFFKYDDGMELCNMVFTVSKESAEILAKEMTELANNQKYRKRLYRYFGLFI